MSAEGWTAIICGNYTTISHWSIDVEETSRGNRCNACVQNTTILIKVVYKTLISYGNYISTFHTKIKNLRVHEDKEENNSSKLKWHHNATHFPCWNILWVSFKQLTEAMSQTDVTDNRWKIYCIGLKAPAWKLFLGKNDCSTLRHLNP